MTKKELTAFDPTALINDAITSGLDPAIFDEINDRDIRRAPNIVSWLLDKNYLGIKPYPRQLKFAMSLAADLCHNCSDMDFWKHLAVDANLSEMQDRLVSLEYGICPKCKAVRTDFLARDRMGMPIAPNELDVAAGQRGGKSLLTAAIATYATHRVLTLPSPAEYFGLVRNSMLIGTFVAVTATQAQQTLWQAFKDLTDQSSWFRDYHSILDEEGSRLGVKLYKRLDTLTEYQHKRIFFSYQGADTRTLRGRTRFFAAIDELGWFDAHAGAARIRVNAQGTYEALTRSLATLRAMGLQKMHKGDQDVPIAWICNISSPSEVNDMIMRLIREGADDPTKCVFHLPTWEMNPNITEAMLDSEKRKDPHTFARDFGAVPPLANSPFLHNIDDLMNTALRSSRIPVAGVRERTFVDEFGKSYVHGDLINVQADKINPRVIAVDAGETSNSFAVCMAHLEEGNKTVVDFLAEISPKGESTVHFPKVFDDIILKLVENYHIKVAAYDRWNSSDQVQRLRAHSVEAIKYTMTFPDFVELRGRVYSDLILFPKPEKGLTDLASIAFNPESLTELPVAQALLQFATVRGVGRRVVKPLRGNDDLFRAVALADYLLHDPKLVRRHRLNFTSRAINQFGISGTVGVSRGLSTKWRKKTPIRNESTGNRRLGILKRKD